MLYNDRQTGEVKELSTPIPLYHGTTSSLKPGDIVEPKGGVAYAAGDKSYAVMHSMRASLREANLGAGREPKVYRVEPLPGVVHKLEYYEGQSPQGQPNVLSPKGFKVVEGQGTGVASSGFVSKTSYDTAINLANEGGQRGWGKNLD